MNVIEAMEQSYKWTRWMTLTSFARSYFWGEDRSSASNPWQTATRAAPRGKNR